MGVLDDAIRQHIELKRAHGASEEDLRREEHEALGPARRESTAPDEEPEVEDAHGDTSDTAALPVADEDLPDPEAFHGDPVSAEPDPFADPEPFADRKAFSDDEPFSDEEPFADPEPPAAAATGDESDDDVLEETPEFLQETPEHDRLWFEQKPPRDFDFDDK